MKNKLEIKPADEKIDVEAAKSDYRYVEGLPIILQFYDKHGAGVKLNCLSESQYFIESLARLVEQSRVEIPLDVIYENPRLIITRTDLELSVVLYLPPFIISPWLGEEYGDIEEIRAQLPELLSILQKMRGEIDEKRFKRLDDKKYLESIDKWIKGERRPAVQWSVQNIRGAKATIKLEFLPYSATISFADYIQTIKQFCNETYGRVIPKEKGAEWKTSHKFDEKVKIAEDFVKTFNK